VPVYVLFFVSGWVAWTLFEYVLHRWVYHIKTENRIINAIQHAGHGIHHQFPRDPTRLAMPPISAIILQFVFFAIFWLLMQNYTFAFFPGFLTGYIVYISLHYLEHCVRPPRFAPLHRLWKCHALHHYKYPETKAFGVSTLIWDVIFGTKPEE
jgi:sterol desaturase/sphingolipid hydroxylase (fatty acid hydroxylase superfamily)